ncbi:MAG: hypothetical protein KBG15_23455, partial [Kofleriaceae bacterium]|nr:hypothetical protein [Kofleriaceae bacterium]
LTVVPLVAACVGNVQRSARVPHPAVPNSTGQPMSSQADLSLGASSITDLVAPAVGDPTQAVEVPSTQVRGEFRLRATENAFVGVVHERGFASTSKQPDTTQAPVGKGDVLGYGVVVGGSVQTSVPELRVGLVGEFMIWNVPYVEYQTLTPGFVGNYTIIERGTDSVATLGLGVSPSYHVGQFTAFGGVFARNHPTTLRKEFDTSLIDGGDVEEGPFNILLDAGVAYDFTKQLTGSLTINQNLTADPVKYGPGLQFALTAKLGE